MDNFRFHIPTKIIYGGGEIQKFHDHLSPAHRRILIVTDKGVATKSGAMDRLRPQLQDRAVFVFDDVEENPSLGLVERGGQFARDRQIDLVVGLGGGSSMDAAKGIALLATNEGRMIDYMQGKQFANDLLPIVCIPTSSGTGSEVTPYAVFTDPDLHTKGGYTHDKLFPIFSIIDPELTYSMPEPVVVNTGLDVLTHAIEAYLSTESFALNDLLALHAVEIVIDNLEQACQKDKPAMNNMAYASTLGGMVIANAGTILLHIMAYPLTVFHDVPHGKANAILLPAFMAFMEERSHIPAKVRRLIEMFDQMGGIEEFIHNLGISTRLADYGVEEAELDTFVQKTIVKDDIKITPAAISATDILTIYRNAL